MPVGTFFKQQVASTEISIPASTFRALLYTTGWIDHSTLREDQDQILNDASSTQSVTAYELSSNPATGYARQLLGARTITEVDARDAVEIDSADVTFASVSSSAGVAGGMALYAEIVANDSSGSQLAAWYDFSSPVTPNGGDITVQFSTGGWMEWLASTSDAS